MIKLAIDSNDFSNLFSRFTEIVTAKVDAEARLSRTLDKLYSAEDTIRDLKAKVAKYEPTPGFPMPTHRQLPSGEEAANKIGEAMKLAAGGNKIGAIKLVRELTGCGLKEAKDAVEIGYPPAPYAAAPNARW